MPDAPGVQWAIYDTKENRIVRKIAYEKDAHSWAKDYEEGNSRFAVVYREIPRWRIFTLKGGRQG